MKSATEFFYIGLFVTITLLMKSIVTPFFSPIAFLFIIALFFTVLFFAVVNYSMARFNAINHENPKIAVGAKRLGIFLMLALFAISIGVIKDYQLPNDDNPYFSNSDHHAIRNEAVAFTNTIELYSEELGSKAGLWPSETGLFVIKANSQNVEFQLDKFFKPVFGFRIINKKKIPYLLNPQFFVPLTAGFALADEHSKILFWKIDKAEKSWKENLLIKENENYSIGIIFLSEDPLITNGNNPISDTMLFKNITLAKGLDIRDLVYKNKNKSAETSVGMIRWLEEFGNIQILADHDSTGKSFLTLFASSDVYNSGVTIKAGSKSLRPNINYKFAFPLDDHFFVGLGNNGDSLSISLAEGDKMLYNTKYTHRLNFFKPDYRKISSFGEDVKRNGSEEIRFLENDFADIEGFKIKEGLVFQKGFKLNSSTALDSAFFRFTNHAPGNALEWEIWSNNENKIIDKNTGRFLLKSRGPGTKLGWIYSIRDFSQNYFTYPRMVVFFSFLTLSILAMLIFYPSIKLITIETPIWMVVYVLIVFRFLLLWRLATFPPLDNISLSEFNALQDFEFRIMNLPFSIFAILATIGVIILIRSNFYKRFKFRKRWVTAASFTNKTIKTPGKWERVIYHCCLIVLGLLIMRVINQGFLVRIVNIVLPIASYLYNYRIITKTNLKFDFGYIMKSEKRNWYLIRFFQHWIETPVFFLSLTTFLFFAYADPGFAVIFLIFLITKNIFLNFSKGNYLGPNNNNGNLFLSPQYFWIYGILSLIIFLTLISFKGFTFYLLEYKRSVLALATIVCTTAFLLVKNKRIRITSFIIGIVILSLLMINPFWEKADEGIDNLIQRVKYRANIIYQPLSGVLLKEQYRTGQEQKIVETAQNQWFINSYLGQSPLLPHKIDFKPHFNKGVNYSTQTRDVILPRYVIAEFGGVVMFLLILLIFTPLILYTLGFRLSEQGKSVFNADAVTGSVALTLLATIALVVWMSSTNRFVFFGQDFPFMSLTSRITILIPLVCYFTVLMGNPVPRYFRIETIRMHMTRWFLFFIGAGLFIALAGKSKELSEGNFKPDFSRVSARFNNTMNEFFINTQQLQPHNYGSASSMSKKQQDAQIIEWLTELKKDPDFIIFYNTNMTNYEKSIFDELSVNPARGFDQRYPVHIINNKNLYTFKFNDYLHFELPAYDVKKVWKGEIYEEIKDNNLINAGIPEAEIIIVPSTILMPGSKPYALIDKTGTGKQVQIYNTKSKSIISYKDTDPVFNLADEDIVLYRDNKYHAFKIWSLGDDKRFFVRNIKVNGTRRMVYPLGKDFYWIREWAETQKTYCEKLGEKELELSSSINLDYDLSKRTGNYLNDLMNSALVNKLTNSNKVVFSVVSADGTGRIRLMSDAAMAGLRSPIDPNNELAIARKIEEEYFFRNNEATRLQWGNTNLLHMRHGPGSSIKPLVLAVVASQRKMEWSKLKYKRNSTVMLDPVDPNYFIIERYAGKKLPLQTGEWREPEYNNKDADLNFYLAESHNLYHSLLIFLGSYKKTEFNATNSLMDVLRIQSHPSDFPLLTLGNGITYTLKDPLFWPKNHQGLPFGDNSSMLAAGLYENLAFATNSASSTGQLFGKVKFTRHDSAILNHGLWAFPEKSFFDQKERTIDFQNAIQMTTLGGGIFRLTPIQTLEMYGKMFNYDRNFSVSIDDSSKNSEPWLNVDQAWAGRFKEDFLMPHVFKGMEEVITSGTAKNYLTALRTRYPNFDFFAKTGTIGSGIGDNSKRLIVVISKKGGLSERKNYYIYFTIQNAYREDKMSYQKNHTTWFWEPINGCIENIIQSASFKKYMYP